jgi:hypothetical protein
MCFRPQVGGWGGSYCVDFDRQLFIWNRTEYVQTYWSKTFLLCNNQEVDFLSRRSAGLGFCSWGRILLVTKKHDASVDKWSAYRTCWGTAKPKLSRWFEVKLTEAFFVCGQYFNNVFGLSLTVTFQTIPQVQFTSGRILNVSHKRRYFLFI